MHNIAKCERCQRDLLLYGQAFVNSRTDEHYDVPTMVRIHGEPDPALKAATQERLSDGAVYGVAKCYGPDGERLPEHDARTVTFPWSRSMGNRRPVRGE